MVYILKSGNNYYELNLDGKTVQELKFYIINPDQSVSQSVPDSRWINSHPTIQDIGAGSYATFIIKRINEYGIGELNELGPRYIQVGL